MKVYIQGEFIFFETDHIKAWRAGTINFTSDTDYIVFEDRNDILFSELYTELTNQAGQPLGASLSATLLALSTLLAPPSQVTADTGVTPVDINTLIENTTKGTLCVEVPFDLQVARGLFEGWSIELKSGRNPDVDTATVPEDVWNGGGVYTGFPTGAPEELQVVSSSASDTGVLTFTYLASNTATAWQTASVQLNGTTPVNTGIVAYRVHTARYAPSVNPSTTFNAGTITVRHRTTTANVFLAIPIRTSQSYMTGYTVPAGSTGFVKRIKWAILGSSTGYCDVVFWIRTLNGAPRLRRNNTAVFGSQSDEITTGGLPLLAGTDIIPRVTVASTNNLVVVCAYDILIVPNS